MRRERKVLAGINRGQQSKSGDGLQPVFHILRVAVHIFEAVVNAVGCWHQLDHALIGVRRNARGLVKRGPTAEILFDISCYFDHAGLDADLEDQTHHVLYTHKRDEG